MNLRVPILAILAGLLACASPPPPPAARGPNLLLVTLDTLRRDAVGCYGAAGARTPVLDRLAREGVLFADAQVPVPLTLSSHATMMTGLYPASHGIRVNALALPEETVTLAERLGARGYGTAAFVASQVLARTYGLARGFEEYDDLWIEGAGDDGLGVVPQRRAEKVVRSFLSWFGDRDRSRPFFAWVHFYDAHSPYDAPPPFEEAVGGDVYAAEVAYADRALGWVLDALESEGIADSTIVMVLSDHGEGLGDHDEESHGFLLFETTQSVPWIARIPGGPAGLVVTDPVESVDLAPTLAALLPIEGDSAWAGRDVTPFFDSPSPDRDRHARYGETFFGNMAYEWAPLRAVWVGDWKMVEGSRTELFDLASDPGETKDLALDRPDQVERLRAGLAEKIGAQVEREATDVGDDLSEEERGMLEALGYVAPARAITESDTLPDPRERYRAHELIVHGKRILREGDRTGAKEMFEEACAIDPRNVTALSALADCLRREENVAEEERILRRILAVEKQNAAAWNNLGNLILRTRRDGDLAKTCYDQSIASDSSYAEAYVNRSNLYLMSGLMDDAEKGYRTALRHESGLPMAHWGLASIYKQKGDFEEHVMQLKLALRADPGFTPAREKLESYGPGFGGDRPPPGIRP
ncbi:MAG: sulfatase-like hydrolase/transferase [Candidatus Eisenbacteria bacterium]